MNGAHVKKKKKKRILYNVQLYSRLVCLCLPLTLMYFPCTDRHAGGASAAVVAGMSAVKMPCVQVKLKSLNLRIFTFFAILFTNRDIFRDYVETTQLCM